MRQGPDAGFRFPRTWRRIMDVAASRARRRASSSQIETPPIIDMPPPPDLKNALLREIEGSVLLKVRAVPGASRERVAGLHGDALKVCVAAPPEKGKANEAIARFLARKLGLKASRVSVHSGDASRDKWIRLEGLTAEAARKALQRLDA